MTSTKHYISFPNKKEKIYLSVACLITHLVKMNGHNVKPLDMEVEPLSKMECIHSFTVGLITGSREQYLNSQGSRIA